ncbi:hypothetical protein O181_082188 [Austropuccinia psidii MF-1]|uniref:Uncharacterized protein n=1 Tax=Austropuccinia psidii MF-1 TaxID=1389203 RepID=A0A9Q3FR99_9BASI|nr:hypothetical protein [Austropuccinia psidii MF-1]
MRPCLIFSLAYNPCAAVGPSVYASNATLNPPFSLHPLNMPPMLLTLLTLAVPSHHAPNARGVPSKHASNAAYHPYSPLVPSRHASNASYHLMLAVPSQHASNAPLTLA